MLNDSIIKKAPKKFGEIENQRTGKGCSPARNMTNGQHETPDEVLVVAAILGDLAAFDELASRYRGAVVRTAGKVVGKEDAEDVAQDALLLAFKALPSIEEPSRFSAWLMVITRHRALRFVNQNRRFTEQCVAFDEVLRSHLDVLNQPPSNENADTEIVHLALNRLPEPYATLMRLRYLDEMPLHRIAAFTDVPLNTVKWRVQRGKRLMRDAIEQLEEPVKQWKKS